MAYIGKQPVVGNFVKLDAIVTSATATYNLLNGGVAYFPQTANNCIVSLNGVIQSPTSAYTISGSTIVFDSALTSLDTIDFILVLGDVLAIGTPSDGTVTSAKLASGTAGLINWQSVQTTGFTASAGRGYPCNTTSAAFTVTLPASPSVGDTIILLDYAGTFATNNITLGRNSNKIEGGTNNKLLTTNREAVTLVYVDSTQGWVASSGTNFGSQSIDPLTYSVDFLVIAGGGAGGSGNNTTNNSSGGGGGAGGYRTSTQSVTSGTVITVTVGDGGAGTGLANGATGSASSISGSGLTTISSAGGGGGANVNSGAGLNGGSGGGAGGETNASGGSGNTPSTSPSQGNSGGAGTNGGAPAYGSGGGGGAGAVGQAGTTAKSGDGGAGFASSITGSSVTRAGGGSGGNYNAGGAVGGTGGGGTGGGSGPNDPGAAGTANTGSGGGGAKGTSAGGAGGKGVVILSVPDANYSSTTTGSPTVTPNANSTGKTVIQFNGDGSYTA